MNSAIQFRIEESIGVLLINRPERRNALDWAAQADFAATIKDIAGRSDLRALILTGAGEQVFVAGGDLSELVQAPTAATGQRLHEGMTAALAQLNQLPIPVIAAINGLSVGGGSEILTACDLRLAVSSAQIRFSQVRMGLSTGWGGGRRLVAQIGQSRALELLLTGRTMTAQEAYEMGFVHRLVDSQAELLPAALAWARELAALPADALAGLKQMVHAQVNLPAQEARSAEGEIFLGLFGQANNREALAAFQARRQPQFNQINGEAVA